MGKRDKTLVVIPAFNEGQNVARVIAKVQQTQLPLDILVINDGSSDDTAKIAEDAGALVISLPSNMGYVVALQTGFKYATKKGYDHVIHLDGDGQHEPKCISKILNELQQERVDIVIGSRFLGSGKFDMTFAKRLAIFFFRTVVSVAIKQKITDPTSGFRGLSKDAIRFYSTDVYPDDFPDADVIITSHLAGFRIKEIPVTMYPNTTHKSMHSGVLKPLYYVFKVLLSILVTLLHKKPYLRGGRSHGY